MSLLQPTDVADQLSGFTDAQRQNFIDRAEAYVAGLLGRRPVSSDAGIIGSIDIGVLSDTGGVTVDSNENPIEDPTDSNFVGSPLGSRTEEIDLYVEFDARILEVPVGPITLVDDIEWAGNLSPGFTTFDWQPWSVQLTDTRQRFQRGQNFKATVHTGFTRNNVPDKITEAVRLAMDIFRSDRATAGVLGTAVKTGEQLGPFRATFAQPSTSAMQSSQGEFTRNPHDILHELVRAWAEPRGSF